MTWKCPNCGFDANEDRNLECTGGCGYVKLAENAELHPWMSPTHGVKTLNAHEFHYSSLDGLPKDSQFAYQVRRGSGIQQNQDGLVYRNLLAAYTHQRNTQSNPWVKRFLGFVKRNKPVSATDVASAL